MQHNKLHIVNKFPILKFPKYHLCPIFIPTAYLNPELILMKYHFIAIGGAVMHNLAIALHKKGHTITGSDDEIFEPSRSRLEEHKLLPENPG